MKQFISLLFLGIVLTSCGSTRKVAYFQDIQPNMTQQQQPGKYITAQPQDMLYITVSSKDPQLAVLFNLPRIQTGMEDATGNTRSSGMLGYTVDSDGTIDFPLLGRLSVAGLTREQVASKVKETLIDQNLIKDPIVTVTFSNLTFSTMGEVARPGQYSIDKDQITVLEALSKSGDLTIHGQRDKVYVIRNNGTERISYQLDLTSSQIYHSPGFYIQQNDVIYVEPNKVRINQSTVNGNNVRSVSLWMSIASFLTTIGVLIFK